MRVLLINPSSEFVTFKTHETLGLGYLASALERAGHETVIYDCNFQDAEPAAIARMVSRQQFGTVGIATMIGKAPHAMELATAIRAATGAFIVLGGYTATYEYEEILSRNPAVDAIVRGEAEYVLPGLVERVERGEPWHDMDALTYRGEDKIVSNKLPHLHMGLDDLPFPRRSPYLARIGLASILSSRGCYAKCSFCNIQEFYNLAGFGGIRVRSAVNIVDEIEMINSSHGIRKFLFIDDDMLGADFYVPGRNAGLAKEIMSRGLDIDFEVAGRANDVIRFESTLSMLRDAGLSRVYIGIESGSETQLKRQRKGVHKHHNVEALEVLRRNGLGLDMGFIPFDPWSTPDEVVENFRFLHEMGVMEAANLNSAAVTMIMYPGTALYTKAQADGLFERSDNFTYSYRFAHAEHSELFTRIIHTIKRKPVLDSVDRFIGAVKADPELRTETSVVLDPAARHLFGLWTELFAAWCAGEDGGPLGATIEAVEAAIQNFCLSGVYLREMELGRGRGNPPSPGLQADMQLRHDELAGSLCSLVAADILRPPDVAEPRYLSDPSFISRTFADAVRRASVSSTATARRYLDDSACVERFVSGGGQHEAELLTGSIDVFVPADGRVAAGLLVEVPATVMDRALYAAATSQMEKADSSVHVALLLDDGESSPHRITRGWSDVEFEIPAPDLARVRGFVVRSEVAMEEDILVRGRWWRPV